MSIFKEFKEFISRGNVIDLAVGVIIGAAFGKIVTSLVEDIIMPVIGMATGNVDFTDLKYVLKPAVSATDGTVATPEVALRYGNFIQVTFQFLIVAAAIFMLIKVINSLRRKQAAAPEAAAPPAPTAEELLLMEIRDELRARPRV